MSVSDPIRDLLRREGIEAKLCRPADRVGRVRVRVRVRVRAKVRVRVRVRVMG